MSAYDSLLARLVENGKLVQHRGNDQASAQCPAHDDNNPSLSITRKPDKAVLYCHAGCDNRSILDALGLHMRDMFDNRIGETYTYSDGRIVHRRYGDDGRKTFPQAGNKSGTALYRVEHLTGSAPGQTVFVTEGEKCANALADLGHLAVSPAMGAGKAHKFDWSPLAGYRVVIVQDKDEPGRKHAQEVLELVARIAAGVVIVEAKEGNDISDHLAAGHEVKDLRRVEVPKLPIEDDEKPEKISAASALVNMALAHYDLGVTPAGEPYAITKEGGHIARPLRGGKTGLRPELSKRYFQETGKAAPQQALADALLVLEGMCADQEPVETHLRVAEHNGVVYVDMGDVESTVIRIDSTGYRLLSEDVPVRFKRTVLTAPFPRPEPGGDLNDLWTLVNVAEADRPLVLAGMIAALIRPQIPHPIMSLFGEQGSGKSSGARTFVAFTDPSAVPLRKPPRDMDSWVTAAAGSYVVGIDNLSTVPDWLSDSLCRAATGEGDVKRQLYTDAGLAVISFRRWIILNGIDIGAMRGDLAERSLVVNLERISPENRRTEEQLGQLWAESYPKIFGALLELAAGVKRVLPSVELDSSPRMADFARVLAAVDQLLGTDGLKRYSEQAETLAEDTLSADPFLDVLRHSLTTEFEGTAAELLIHAAPLNEDWKPPRGWPKSARQVTSTLRRNAPALRTSGWTVRDLGSSNKAKTTKWLIAPPEKARSDDPLNPPNPPSQVRGTKSGGSTAGQAGKAGQDTRRSDTTIGGSRAVTNPPKPATPANENALTSTDGSGGEGGLLSGPSQETQVCPECGFPLDGVARGKAMHPDCERRANQRQARLELDGGDAA
ncbi:toprim domain-containing protein [Rhodococcus pyridinivorans]|nr:toprim domain-containing protein [Rhodococcus pyridinivorans]UGQ60077.1 toprim domain-containing protein [Rhodococcus pyridinivorans]